MSGNTKSAPRARRSMVVVFAAALIAMGVTGCQRPEAKDRVVIFVHGWSAVGNGVNCQGSFGNLKSSLVSRGFTGQMVTVGFYDSDTNCDVNLRDWGNVDNGTSWKTLSQAFSKFVHETYTSKGIIVDVVGHSMGGLIVRGAVYGSSTGQAGFSSPIAVEDGITLAAPHNGAAWYSSFCLWGQCAGMKPGSSELNWVNADKNPQSPIGTEWTTFGSTNDDTVPAASSAFMDLPLEREVTYSNLEHSDYQNNTTAQARIADALSKSGV